MVEASWRRTWSRGLLAFVFTFVHVGHGRWRLLASHRAGTASNGGTRGVLLDSTVDTATAIMIALLLLIDACPFQSDTCFLPTR